MQIKCGMLESYGHVSGCCCYGKESCLDHVGHRRCCFVEAKNGTPVEVVKPGPEAAAQRIAEGLGVPHFGQLAFLLKTSLV